MTFKKLLILFALLFSFTQVQAAELKIVQQNNSTVTVNSSIEKKTWIGVYEKGTSNEWKNVKAWQWAEEKETTINIDALRSGDYQIRLFYNNSYITEKSIPLSIKNLSVFKIQEQTGTEIKFIATLKKDAWIGIYEKGSNNEWKNVKGWQWVKKGLTSIRIDALKVGNYQARLFLNNSFVTEKSLDFKVIGGPNQFQNRLRDTKVTPVNSSEFRVIYEKGYSVDKKDWIGIFKKGATYKRQNLEAWGYVTINNNPNTNTGYAIMKTSHGQKLNVGQYEMVYFSDDSYNQLGDSATLTVKTAFSMYYDDHRGTHNGDFFLQLYDYVDVAQKKDWVAIFKKDAAPIKKNIIAWSYMEDGEVIRDDGWKFIYFANFPQKNIAHTHKVVLFKNDSYDILGQSIVRYSE